MTAAAGGGAAADRSSVRGRPGKSGRHLVDHGDTTQETSMWKRAFDFRSENAEERRWVKEDVTEVLWWMKQVVAVVVGFLCGSVPVVGWLAFVLYAAAQHIVAFLWATQLPIIGSCCDNSDLFTAAFYPAIGVFVLTWTVTYSLYFGG